MKWMFEVDGERECYRILTVDAVITHDDIKERQWIADVFSHKDAVEIVELHNSKR